MKMSEKALEMIEELERTAANYLWARDNSPLGEVGDKEKELKRARTKIKRYIKKVEYKAFKYDGLK